MSAVIERIARWADVVCVAPRMSLRAWATAFELDDPVDHGDYLQIEPGPHGLASLLLVERDADLFYLRIEPGTATIRTDDLERTFAGWSPVVDFPTMTLTKRRAIVSRPGEPYECALFATYASPPSPATTPLHLTLRRDPSTPGRVLFG